MSYAKDKSLVTRKLTFLNTHTLYKCENCFVLNKLYNRKLLQVSICKDNMQYGMFSTTDTNGISETGVLVSYV